uniref:Uncharacterized protein n=1 Tax=Chromera velia CCMP2878 TaxID=1169474 RepID=A0A0G4F4M0_9ALVE|eukprot:Cvel_15049.t1-p1 / transcript=Cvel_15049.t1 / gene=Cvel_15049 / organism=Chromera_velia_CCMP2878 / gene_product=hypothetical protein / transcript_product=hypothetical protein / location=Cvel_scaffold1096:7280-9436(-) / protein_length=473 / sequence_SO=supercontig / SO=protein_coding / is_pseudo=false
MNRAAAVVALLALAGGRGALGQFFVRSFDIDTPTGSFEHLCATGVENRQSVVDYLTINLEEFENGTAGEPYSYVFTYERNGTQFCPERITVVDGRVTDAAVVPVNLTSSSAHDESTSHSPSSTAASGGCKEQMPSEFENMTIPFILNHLLEASDSAIQVCWSAATNDQTGERAARGVIAQEGRDGLEVIAFSLDNIVVNHTDAQAHAQAEQHNDQTGAANRHLDEENDEENNDNEHQQSQDRQNRQDGGDRQQPQNDQNRGDYEDRENYGDDQDSQNRRLAEENDPEDSDNERQQKEDRQSRQNDEDRRESQNRGDYEDRENYGEASEEKNENDQEKRDENGREDRDEGKDRRLQVRQQKRSNASLRGGRHRRLGAGRGAAAGAVAGCVAGSVSEDGTCGEGAAYGAAAGAVAGAIWGRPYWRPFWGPYWRRPLLRPYGWRRPLGPVRPFRPIYRGGWARPAWRAGWRGRRRW